MNHREWAEWHIFIWFNQDTVEYINGTQRIHDTNTTGDYCRHTLPEIFVYQHNWWQGWLHISGSGGGDYDCNDEEDDQGKHIEIMHMTSFSSYKHICIW